jgi:DNA-binding transcriptional regulator YdaS (Cro superfamily)
MYVKKITPSDIIDAVGGTAEVARKTGCKMSTVSDWRKIPRIPDGKVILIVCELEEVTNGKIGRKQLFPKTWKIIWPELETK